MAQRRLEFLFCESKKEKFLPRSAARDLLRHSFWLGDAMLFAALRGRCLLFCSRKKEVFSFLCVTSVPFTNKGNQ